VRLFIERDPNHFDPAHSFGRMTIRKIVPLANPADFYLQIVGFSAAFLRGIFKPAAKHLILLVLPSVPVFHKHHTLYLVFAIPSQTTP
jgi:hypothetical protein